MFEGYPVLYVNSNVEMANNNWRGYTAWIETLRESPRDPNLRVNRHSLGEIEMRVKVGEGNYRMGSMKRFSAMAGQNMSGAKGKLVLFDEFTLMENSKEYFANMSATWMAMRGYWVAAMTSPRTWQQFLESEWIRQIFEDVGMLPQRLEDTVYVAEHPAFPNVSFIRQPINVDIVADVQWATAQVLDMPDRKEPKAYWRKLGEDWLTTTQRQVGASQWRREYLCAWEIDTQSPVADEFVVDAHRSAEAEYSENHPVYVAIDQGGGNAMTVFLLFQWVYKSMGGKLVPCVHVFDELTYVRRQLRARQALTDVLRFMIESGYKTKLNYGTDTQYGSRKRPYERPDAWCPDIRAVEFVDELKDMYLKVWAESVPLEHGIGRMNYYLRMGQMLIHPRCQRLVSDLKTWQRDSKGKPGDRNNDAAQALIYGIVNTELKLNHYAGERNELVRLARGKDLQKLGVGMYIL